MHRVIATATALGLLLMVGCTTEGTGSGWEASSTRPVAESSTTARPVQSTTTTIPPPTTTTLAATTAPPAPPPTVSPPPTVPPTSAPAVPDQQLICTLFETGATSQSRGLWPFGSPLEVLGGTLHGPFAAGQPIRLLVADGGSTNLYLVGPDGVSGLETFGPSGPAGLSPAKYDFGTGVRGAYIDDLDSGERICEWFN